MISALELLESNAVTPKILLCSDLIFSIILYIDSMMCVTFCVCFIGRGGHWLYFIHAYFVLYIYILRYT
jgi:hypothetical protein